MDLYFAGYARQVIETQLDLRKRTRNGKVGALINRWGSRDGFIRGCPDRTNACVALGRRDCDRAPNKTTTYAAALGPNSVTAAFPFVNMIGQ